MPPPVSIAEVFDIPPGTEFRGHEHDGMHVCAVLRGGFLESLPRAEQVAAAGTVRLSPSTTHRIRFGPAGARCLLVQVAPGDAEALLRTPLARSAFLSDPGLSGAAQALGGCLVHAKEGAVPDDQLLEFLGLLARSARGGSSGPPPPWLRRVREQLLDQWRTPPRAAELARVAGVHRVHLVRRFRDQFGLTVREFVRRRRARAAVQLLLETDLPLSRVAAECGFADQAHLTRALRWQTGHTPRQLRSGAIRRLLPFKTGAGGLR